MVPGSSIPGEFSSACFGGDYWWEITIESYLGTGSVVLAAAVYVNLALLVVWRFPLSGCFGAPLRFGVGVEQGV